MSFKTNNEYWKELADQGWHYSYLIDGKPENLADQIIGLTYPITIFTITALAFIFYFRLPDEKKRPQSLIAGVGTATLMGWIWGVWMLHADPVYPGWLFPPWAVTNIEFILPIEDWLFYPSGTTLFYIIYRHLDVKDVMANRTLIINIIIILYLFLIVFFLFFTASCGKSVALFFLAPGLILFIYSRDVLNVKKFIYFLPILIIIDCVWDWAGSSWVYPIDGMSWAVQWAYVSFNKAGEHIHSAAFLDYVEYPWAWIFNNPIEISPGLGLAGAILNFSLFTVADKFFDQKSIHFKTD